MSDKRHILIVDDDEDSLFLLQNALKEKYHCSTAESIKDAKHIIANEHPDIVLSDYDLSGTSYDEPDVTANALSETIRQATRASGKRIGMIVRSGFIPDSGDPLEDHIIGRNLRKFKHARFPVDFLSKSADDFYNIIPTIEAMKLRLEQPRGSAR